ncbi:MAG TPA: cell wall hydrolase [Gemmatimonadales bacterium]|nr:cell wall hydrolase [Gemmatimonadales bacterium]
MRWVLLAVLLVACAVDDRVVEMIEPVVPLKAGDVDTLARVLWGEARGEGRAGLEAVAWVVVNRVRQPGTRFPDTISGVCRQPFQFSCLNKSDPNAKRCAAVSEADPTFLAALSVATDVLSGRVPDPVGGAQYYFVSNMKDPPNWRKAMQLKAKIGAHSFYWEP